jgi:hypothetical protein
MLRLLLQSASSTLLQNDVSNKTATGCHCHLCISLSKATFYFSLLTNHFLLKLLLILPDTLQLCWIHPFPDSDGTLHQAVPSNLSLSTLSHLALTAIMVMPLVFAHRPSSLQLLWTPTSWSFKHCFSCYSLSHTHTHTPFYLPRLNSFHSI